MSRELLSWIAAGLAACLLFVGAAASQVPPPNLANGQAIAQARCAACHAIGPSGDSPLADAPKFRDLHKHFDVADLQEALAEGIIVGHGPMPAWALSATDVRDLVGYLKSLDPKA
ncbi:mono/diheme cytochrome c family protein [Caulobacter ginsengisoli]|jgi:mono/diheme cytochrome c family protein|uniref:Mono/diheme cytochrome c family protein n=1 Tax=Caulobacter ginsengisoli TaxID=400775 RepID=A0ABU0IZX6_9CAUL|nr:cytochrome c [Caulobacter ginsengisoli]MDQ0466574.1 mono/diheme cytochrome c family protein [Caulobacter ginsengisoli]